MRTAPRVSIQSLTRRYGPWLGLLLFPLALNLLAWRALVLPQRANLGAWRNTQTLTELQPKLATLLSESHQVLTEWRRTAFTSDDPSAVMQTVQQLAGRHHVDVRQLNVSGMMAETAEPGALPAGGSAPVEIQATGRFNQLTRWMSDVETQSGLQIDSWILVPGKASEQSSQLTVKMTALLQGP